jgi:ribitol-5-phosphate 2-dehydrogenase
VISVPTSASVYRLTHPFRIERVEESIPAPDRGWVLLRPLRLGICGSDLKLYTGARERSALLRKLPMALLHEGVAEVVAAGEGTPFRPGEHVVPAPNLPCTVAHPDRYPSIEQACYACRPGGAGANYCTDGQFLSSNVDGMARTVFLHPAACTIGMPEGASDTLAVLVEPLATVLAGLEHVPPGDGRRFLVLGNGTMGLLTLIALRMRFEVDASNITITGHHWESRTEVVEGLGRAVEADGSWADEKPDTVDVAFECVGGDASAPTLGLAIQKLRPGGTGVIFGPSEGPMLVDTRMMIAKGLSIVGCNRALPRHFADALALVLDPVAAPLLERALAPKEFMIGGAHDLDDAMYHAWTKTDAGRVVTLW